MLTTTPNFESPDDFYEALVGAHQGLTEAESHEANPRLILSLANHSGDMAILREALAAAVKISPRRPQSCSSATS